MFPTLKSFDDCISNILAIDKIFFLVKHTGKALIESQNLLDDEELFGPVKGVMIADCDLELDEVFGESNIRGKMNI